MKYAKAENKSRKFEIRFLYMLKKHFLHHNVVKKGVNMPHEFLFAWVCNMIKDITSIIVWTFIKKKMISEGYL